MPLRTHRGRAAVYRRLWGWPLRSRGHLAVAMAIVAVVAFTVGAVASFGRDSQDPAAARPPANVEESSTGESSTTASDSESASSTTSTTSASKPALAPPRSLVVATRFAEAWTHHPPEMTQQQFLDQLRPLAMPEFLITLKGIDPARVPDTRLVGAPTATRATSNLAEVDIPTDAQKLHLTLVRTSSGWRVHHMGRQ